ncbi:hypothetical protein HK097_007994 [Rhizophlyctis rosea]|uniref:Ankyrin n=1 Tax=Rhizophlyctis rosea TaxID=64517 RepID=A0AAD5X1B2_9FUNG|nr:hypothetical protein HK097_007994 [Rhizophlyctis rosea]
MDHFDAPLRSIVMTWAGSLAVVKYLHAKGCSVKSSDADKRTLLHVTDDPETAKYLVANGANIEAKTSERLTPLMTVATSRRLEVGKVLIEKGADVNFQVVPFGANNKESALSLAAQNVEGLEMVKLLLEHGSRVDGAVVRGAATKGPLSTLKYLVTEHRDKVDIDDINKSFVQASWRKIEILLDAGGDPTIEVTASEVPYLLNPGYWRGDLDRHHVNFQGNSNSADEEGTLEHKRRVLKQLVNLGIDVNAANWEGRTALDFAAVKDAYGRWTREEMEEWIDLLKEFGAERTKGDKEEERSYGSSGDDDDDESEDD